MFVDGFVVDYKGVRVFFGRGVVGGLGRFLKGFSRVAIVTGRSSARVSGALGDVVRVLEENNVGYDVYDRVTPNPWASQADDLGEFLWRNGFDAVVAIGGGSVIDTAKVACVIAASGGRAVDYLYWRRRPRGSLPLFAVNLTHGTGSEVDRYAVLTVDENREKRGIAILYPKASVDDPGYTVTLPRDQTVYTTLDAFYHAYEAATSRSSTPYTLLHSVSATENIAGFIERVLRDPRDLDGRSRLLYGSLLAGIAIDMSGTHIIHAIEHALSGLNPKLPHGCGLGILGPRAVYYTHKARPSESAEILKLLDSSIKPDPGDAGKAMKIIEEFQEKIGFTRKLSDYGFGRDDIKTVTGMVLGGLKYLLEGTPFKVDEQIIKDILEHSL
ncbi:iron-containing alcohol dehydrogenase [Desulfurococcaceae archaeon MEX13E-LK6-19]|nr:iron-containing alcohol dehydrogenase [Desulfurococcaceae archaeon MEX13E-LK6-19]